MSENMSALGMMSEAFFKPRRELLDWLKNDFECNIQKIDECANGAMYLQILDKAYPGKVPMHKIHWGATQEYEMTKNYKLLQEVFKECGLNRSFEISKLTKGRQQENLELLQWLKYVYDRRMETVISDKYKGVERRAMGLGPFPDWTAVGTVIRPRCGGDSSASHRREGSNGHQIRANSSLNRAAPHPKLSIARKPSGQFSLGLESRQIFTSTNDALRIEDLERQIKDLKERLEDVTTSRDFFLNKLKAVEVLSMREATSVLDRDMVLEILYSEHLLEVKIENANDSIATKENVPESS